LRRLLAIAYDALLALALSLVVTGIAMLLTGGGLASPGRPAWLGHVYRAALFLITYGFFAWFWMHGGQTLGMRAWRIRLVNASGRPVSHRQTAVRFAGAWLSALVLGCGYLWMLVDRDRRSWHDRLSGTRLELLPKTGRKERSVDTP
jgi:uncharacterized RDD family membrane protein YckC